MAKPRHSVIREALKLTEAKIEDLAAGSVRPDRLYHYTGLLGLQSIVKSEALWASDVAFLNDSRELQHGMEMCLSAVAAMAKVAKYTAWRRHLTWMTSTLRDLTLPSTYAISFCERSDLLSQWRGYSQGEQGVAIGFDAAKLDGRLSAQARLVKVIYGASKIKQVLGLLVRAFCEQVGDRTANEDEQLDFIACVQRCVPRCKHYGFREEQEWRLVVQPPDATNLEFRVNRTRLVPYIVLESKSKRLPIRSIRVGPANHGELTAQSLKVLLAEHGRRTIPVWLSRIPYRA